MGVIKAIHMGGRGVFQEQSSFENCATANFIYGPNGSGKSTISNFLGEQGDLGVQSSGIDWEGAPSEILVYNKEWREGNFRDQSSFPGVFTLGSDSVEAQRTLDGLEGNLEKARKKIASARAQLADKERDRKTQVTSFQNSVWDNVFKPNEKSLGPVLDGYRRSKSKFAEKLLEGQEEVSDIAIDDLADRIAVVFSDEQETIDNLDVDIFRALIGDLTICEGDSLWGLAITGNQDVDIAALIDSLGNSDWVRQGMNYIKETNVCPFCQQHTVTADLKDQLERFFDDRYEANLHKVKNMQGDYRSAGESLVLELERLLMHPIMTACDLQLRQSLEADIKDLRLRIEGNIKVMKNKEVEPSRKILIDSCKNLYDESLRHIIAMDKAIDEYNAALTNINEEKRRLVDEAWMALRKNNAAAIQAHEATLREMDKTIKGLKDTITRQEGQSSSIVEQIAEIQMDITSIQPTVDEMNRSLVAYGFDGFSIQPSNAFENAYQIVREDGTPAGRTLSEGEETFVAFLYFMQLIKGPVAPDRFSQEKVVVIDDPICSLDSTVLYIVSCMVKQLLDDAKQGRGGVKQVFVLTHNVFFHKEASFSKGKAYSDAKTKYWTIRKRGNQSSIKDHGNTNPIKTSYELLWEEVKDGAASAVALQNSMRRIIENYFRMLGNERIDVIEERFGGIEERMICRSLFAWMNDGSHSIPDDLYIDSYSESSDKYRKVFRLIFEYSGNIEHYKMMMGEVPEKDVNLSGV